MEDGYIKLWRKSLNSGLLQNPHLWTFWCWCLMKATWKPIKQMVGNQMVELLPGQFIFGRKAAAEELEVGETIIRTRLEILKKLGNLAIKTTNKFSIITICNWNIYQNSEKENGQQTGQQRANNGPTTGHKQEVKELKEEKKKEETTLSVSVPKHDYAGEAREVLAYLNEKQGRKFEDTKQIIARLRQGGTVEQCKQIIDTKSKDPHFIATPKYMCPNTLFRASHWDSYLNEKPEDYEKEPLDEHHRKNPYIFINE